jgi:hypothetical protein
MKAKLTFNLPEERDELKLAQRGADYFCFLWDLDQELRSWLKYGHNFKTPDEVIEAIREKLSEVEIWDIE